MLDQNEIDRRIRRLQSNIEEKLKTGRDRVSTANNDPEILGLALLSFHGALEDHIRLSLALISDDSDSTEKYLTPSETRWNDLLSSAKQNLGLSQRNADLISEANAYRIDVGHGKANTWNVTKLLNYINFVESWCSKNPFDKSKKFKDLVNESQSQKEKFGNQYSETYSRDYNVNPWYRSSCFMWFIFFFIPPIWGLLILTDEDQSAFIKIIALIFCVIVSIFWLYLI